MTAEAAGLSLEAVSFGVAPRKSRKLPTSRQAISPARSQRRGVEGFCGLGVLGVAGWAGRGAVATATFAGSLLCLRHTFFFFC